jgi:hypothetical protein
MLAFAVAVERGARRARRDHGSRRPRPRPLLVVRTNRRCAGGDEQRRQPVERHRHQARARHRRRSSRRASRAPAAAWRRRAPDSGRANRDCRPPGWASVPGLRRTATCCGSSETCSTCWSATMPTSAEKAPSPITVARSSERRPVARTRPASRSRRPLPSRAAKARSVKGRATGLPFCTDRHGRKPDHSRARHNPAAAWRSSRHRAASLMRPIERRAPMSAVRQAATRDRRRPARSASSSRRSISVARAFLPAPPGGDIGKLQILAEQAARERRHERAECGRFDDAGAGRVGRRPPRRW